MLVISGISRKHSGDALAVQIQAAAVARAGCPLLRSIDTGEIIENRLPRKNSRRARLRRGNRIAAGRGTRAVTPAWQHRSAQARGHAAGVLLQAAWRFQQDSALPP